MAAREQVVEIENLQGLDHPQAVEAVELRVGGLVHKRVHMNGIDRLDVGTLLHHAPDGAEHGCLLYTSRCV